MPTGRWRRQNLPKMPEYIGAARANLAWVALTESKPAQAREHSLAALEVWNQSPGIQAAATPYYWTAIWPLVRVCLDEGTYPPLSPSHAKLIEPQRKGLPADLTAALTSALDPGTPTNPRSRAIVSFPRWHWLKRWRILNWLPRNDFGTLLLLG